MQRIFHTPEGVRDIYNGECSQKHHLQTEIRTVFDSYGYFLTVKEIPWYYARTSHHPYQEPALLILIRSTRL